MVSQAVLVSVFELLVGLGCLAIGAVAWRYRERPAGTPLVLLSLAAAGWAATAGLASLAADPRVTRWAQLGTYWFAGAATVCWFFLAAAFTGRDWWHRPPVAPLVVGLLAVEGALLLTNPLHHYYITADSQVTASGILDPTPGPLLWLLATWKVGLILTGCVLVLQRRPANQGILGVQTAAVLTAGVLPVLAAVVELLDLVGVTGLDIGVAGVAAGTAAVLWALFYADFLDVLPISRATLIESMPDAVVAIDTEGRVVDLNSRAKRVFGVDAGVVGRPAAAVVGDRDGLPTEPGTPLPEPAEVTIEVAGAVCQYEMTVSPIQSPSAHLPTGASGRQLGSLLVFRNVTERHRRERELELKNARLEEFSSVVSHDLRNPLTVAQGRLELARQEGDSEHFDPMGRSLDRMGALIEDLLALARTGRTITDPEPVALSEVAASCWENVDTLGATLVVESDRRLSADRNRLQELLENLVRNAVEHGGETVTVTVGDLDDGGFYVADDGVGIPGPDREHVFEHGYSGRADGTGLGLAIVDEIARAHGWTPRVTESAAGGTRFEFAAA